MPAKPSAIKEKAATPGSVGLNAAHFVMAAFFLLAAGLQHNDPDPEIWMTLYGAACLVCSFFIAGFWFARTTAIALGLACSVFGAFIAASLSSRDLLFSPGLFKGLC